MTGMESGNVIGSGMPEKRRISLKEYTRRGVGEMPKNKGRAVDDPKRRA